MVLYEARRSTALHRGECGGRTYLNRLLAIRFLQVAVIRIRRNAELADKDEHYELHQGDLSHKATSTYQVIEPRL